MQGEPKWRNCNISKHKQVRSQNNHRTEGRYAASWGIWAILAQAHVNPAEKIDECLNSPQLRREVEFGEISRVYRASKAQLWRRHRTSIQQRRSTNVWTCLNCEGNLKFTKSAAVYRASRAQLQRRQRISIQQRRSTIVWTRLNYEAECTSWQSSALKVAKWLLVENKFRRSSAVKTGVPEARWRAPDGQWRELTSYCRMWTSLI